MNLHNHILSIAEHIKRSESNLLEEKEQILKLFTQVEHESKQLFAMLDAMLKEKNYEQV